MDHSTDISKTTSPLRKVISGGQDGADRIGLEEARALGLKTGGTAPKGYRTIHGSDWTLRSFGLIEDTARAYAPRTEKNVLGSDATVVFGDDVNSPGTRLTRNLARKHGKPYVENPSPDELCQFVNEHNVEVLNIAGNRAFKDRLVIRKALSKACEAQSI